LKTSGGWKSKQTGPVGDKGGAPAQPKKGGTESGAVAHLRKGNQYLLLDAQESDARERKISTGESFPSGSGQKLEKKMSSTPPC